MRKLLTYIIIVYFSLAAFDFGVSAQIIGNETKTDFKERMVEYSEAQAEDAAKIIGEVEDIGIDLINNISLKFPKTEADVPLPDTPVSPLAYSREQRWWWNLLKEGKLDMKDTTVIYPKFIKFCVDVYNWADRTFNSYDPEYVVGTGKRWKVRIVSDNWLDSYALKLPQGVNAWMMSDVYSNLGAYLQYMAVSVGSSYDTGKLFNKREPSHKKYEFGFICALFNAEIYYHENTGGTNMRRFGDYKAGKHIKEYFPGVEMYTLGFDAYYFFNNKKYSQGAAYNFSKYQLKSQGSFLIGFSFTNQKLNFDFRQLPKDMKPFLTIPEESNYYFHYNSYALLFGYGYNWVIAPKLLFNASLMPSIGASHYYEDSLEGNKWMLSLNAAARISLTYNLGNYFFGLFGKMTGHLYKNGHDSLFSSIENFSAYVGLRF